MDGRNLKLQFLWLISGQKWLIVYLIDVPLFELVGLFEGLLDAEIDLTSLLRPALFLTPLLQFFRL